MEDIEKLLVGKAKLIDALIEKYIPRKYDKKSLIFTCGEPRYEYNTQAVQKSIAEPIWELLDRGGKRWRPVLFLLVYEALGGDPKKVMDFAIIPEVTHEGTLVIDDIEDNSELRRGKPCIHKIFGTDVAINVGNTMYYLPLLVLLKNRDNFQKEILLKLYEIYSQEMINLGFGQGTDIAWHRGLANADNIKEGEYLQMCAYKTGVLARMAAKMAAVLADATDDQVEVIGKFAEAIGIAFQIQDDILNLTATSDKAQFVKEYIGSDITEGKRTLMIIHTLIKANKRNRKRLLEILSMHTTDQKLKEEAIGIIKKYGSVEYAKEFARKLVKSAWNKVDELFPSSDAKEKLRAFANYLIERKI
ncbi:MAG: polyprenyl synthetase family protein [Candidatus Aenigmarchaeota archaeon]|nr:polyprenyl synthetase family protein [Candidatus Aenigmarchaeota archaeon]